METITVNDKATLDELYKGSALTLEGCAPTKENIDWLFGWLKDHTPLKRERVYIVSGSLMNMAYGLTGDNAYPETNCTLVCVKLEDLENPASITTARFWLRGRWFDDVVDNNSRREEEER